jgi:ATP-dependent RNA helicase SUPV3L1/SUV3
VLMDRLSAVRTWSYISQKSHWLAEPELFRERTRAIEDQLGDVLHQRLLERFVAERSTRRPHGQKRNERPSQASGHPFGKLAALVSVPAQPDFHEQLIAASFAELPMSADGVISFEGERVARLVAGPSLLHPQLKLLLDDVAGGLRSRIERRLLAHTRDLVADLLSPLSLPGEQSAPLRGLLYQLEQGLGSVGRREAAAGLLALTDRDRQQLVQAEIIEGRHALFSRPSFSAQRMRVRAVLCRLSDPSVASLPAGFELSAASRSYAQVARDTLLRLGFVKLKSWLLRCDVLEMLVRSGAADPTRELSERVATVSRLLGCGEDEATEVAEELTLRRRARRR